MRLDDASLAEAPRRAAPPGGLAADVPPSAASAQGPAPLRVVLFANTDWYLYNFRLGLARALAADGHAVTLLSPPGPYGERLRALGLDWRPLPLARRSVNVVRELLALARLVRLYRALRPDVAHHFTLECIVLGSLAARLARVPAVVNAAAGLGSVFAGRSRRARLLRRPVTTLLKRAFARSEAILQNPDDLERLVGAEVVNGARAHLIRGSGVDAARFAATRAPRAAGAGNVLFASRLLYSKGLADFVDAARRLKPRLPAADFVVAGEPDTGSLDAVSARDLDRWRREGVVELLGHRDDMPALLANASLVVLPTYYGEGVPRILVEAAASGLPLVASDMPGCREVVRHGENGLLVPPRDPGALAEAIAALLNDPARCAQMGERSRAIAAATFAEREVVRETIAVYRAALARSVDAPAGQRHA